MRATATAMLALIAVAVSACGDDGGGDTTINQTTTTIITTTTETTSTTGASTQSQETSGPCDASREPTPTVTGFADLQVTEGSCEYAEQVAVGFADAYGPDCFGGCTKLIEGIRCGTQAPTHAEVVCAAARTEVRFTISGED